MNSVVSCLEIKPVLLCSCDLPILTHVGAFTNFRSFPLPFSNRSLPYWDRGRPVPLINGKQEPYRSVKTGTMKALALTSLYLAALVLTSLYFDVFELMKGLGVVLLYVCVVPRCR